MANIVKWFEEMAGDEEIIAATLGRHYREEFSENPASHPVGKVMPWSDARKVLDYEYDSGYGGDDCHPVFAWTETKLLTITEYDGATSPAWFPRNPCDVKPGFDGVDELNL